MTHRTRLSLLTLAVSIGLATVPAVASAGAGFTVPSGNTVCGILTAKQASGRGAGLYCSSSYIPRKGELEGGVKLNRTGKARQITLGNDDSLPISGYNGEGREYSKRPVLGYGKTWKRSGFTCVSRSTGLTCRRGSHGFFLSRESRRFF